MFVSFLEGDSVPSRDQIRNIAKYERAKTLLSKDEVVALQLFPNSFVRILQIIPNRRIVIATDAGLQLLKSAEVITIDTTFGISADGANLTSILIPVAKFTVAPIRILHYRKDTAEYTQFLEDVWIRSIFLVYLLFDCFLGEVAHGQLPGTSSGASRLLSCAHCSNSCGFWKHRLWR